MTDRDRSSIWPRGQKQPQNCGKHFFYYNYFLLLLLGGGCGARRIDFSRGVGLFYIDFVVKAKNPPWIRGGGGLIGFDLTDGLHRDVPIWLNTHLAAENWWDTSSAPLEIKDESEWSIFWPNHHWMWVEWQQVKMTWLHFDSICASHRIMMNLSQQMALPTKYYLK